MKTMDYHQDIEIDVNILDIEWINQPNLFMQYSENAAESKKNLDLAKEKMELATADTELEIRGDPERFYKKHYPNQLLCPKVTEGVINSLIKKEGNISGSNLYIKRRAYIEMKYEEAIASSAVKAFDQRKTALEKLVNLVGMDFFSKPKEPHDPTSVKWQKQIEEKRSADIRTKTTEAMKRRRTT